MSNNFKIIHQYCRKQALADGILIDVTNSAKQTGIKWPLAVTASVWSDYVM